MNIALSTYPALAAPLQGILRWLGASTLPARVHRSAGAGLLPTSDAPKIIATRAASERASIPFHAHSKPLRVVRVMEAGQARSSVGRMVISGRMADVCAELDRLAAGEAART